MDWEIMGRSIRDTFRTSCNRKDTSKFITLYLNIVWGVWLTINLKLFKEKETVHVKCVVQTITNLNVYPQVQKKNIPHSQSELQINKKISWAFFDGDSQWNP